MNTAKWITAAGVYALAICMMILSILSCMHKGFLLNNAWLFASKKERETMDKRPYYLQSAIVFLILSGVFTVMGVAVIVGNRRLHLLEIPFLLAAVIYAVVSSVWIAKKQKERKQAGAGRPGPAPGGKPGVTGTGGRRRKP